MQAMLSIITLRFLRSRKFLQIFSSTSKRRLIAEVRFLQVGKVIRFTMRQDAKGKNQTEGGICKRKQGNRIKFLLPSTCASRKLNAEEKQQQKEDGYEMEIVLCRMISPVRYYL